MRSPPLLADADYDVAATVFCQNEAARIGACIASIAASAGSRRLALTVIANGSTDGSASVAQQAAESHGMEAAVYRIAHGDKSNAINQANGPLRRRARLHVFVDGYVTIDPGAISALEAALQASPHAVAATGIGATGRSAGALAAATLSEGGRLHGQLHALRPDFLDRMAAQGLHLPVGLYRGDGLLGSMACHDLDAIGSSWDNRRIVPAPDAIYRIAPLSPFRPKDVARQLRRKIRQMRGLMENAAIKSVIYTHGYAALPANADDMIAAWRAQGGHVAVRLPDRPFMAMALRQHLQAPRQAPASLQPVPAA